MGFRQRLASMMFGSDLVASAYGASAPVSQPDHWLVRLVGGAKTNAGVRVSEYTARHLPVVYACINRISNPVASFPVSILRPGDSGPEEATDHPMYRRVKLRPNDFMSSRSMRKTAQGHALLWGNGYLEIERNRGGQAVGLWPLLPDKTEPKKERGDLFFRTNIDGKTFDIDQGDVIHIMDQSQDGYRGLSPIAMARQAIGMGLAMEEFGGKFFANDAKSGGFLMHPGKLSSVAKGNLGGPADKRTDPGASLEKQGGLDNAHRVKVLEEGMKWIQTTIPPEDAQFLGSREFQIAEIARIYDVPLILLQSQEKTSSWGSGIEQLRLGFFQQTIAPWIDCWEQELNWKLFTEAERDQGYHVKFNMNALLRGDMQGRAAFYKTMFELGMTLNQILALEDMNGIGDQGDVPFVSNNVQPLDRAINPPSPPPPATAPAASKEAA